MVSPPFKGEYATDLQYMLLCILDGSDEIAYNSITSKERMIYL